MASGSKTRLLCVAANDPFLPPWHLADLRTLQGAKTSGDTRRPAHDACCGAALAIELRSRTQSRAIKHQQFPAETITLDLGQRRTRQRYI